MGDLAVEKSHFDLNELRNYILYAKMSCNPRLNQEAAVTLQNLYVEDRNKARQAKHTNSNSLLRLNLIFPIRIPHSSDSQTARSHYQTFRIDSEDEIIHNCEQKRCGGSA